MLNSRILTGVSHLQAAFEEARGYSRYFLNIEKKECSEIEITRYHPSRGYWWHFGKEKEEVEQIEINYFYSSKSRQIFVCLKVRQQKKKEEEKEEPSSFFQRRRVRKLISCSILQ